MIHHIYSSLKTFKNIDFQPGLNILMTVKAPESTDQQTRNRAGKTSLIEIIHFLLGANIDTSTLFKAEELIEHSFEMEFDLEKVRVTVDRAGQRPSVVFLKNIDGDIERWPSVPAPDLLGERVINISTWKTVLGQAIFGLNEADSDDEEKPSKFNPTFRSLFGYFARRQSAGGFSSPFKQSEKQLPYDQQVAISYLLGLDWTIPREWEIVRQRERNLRELKKAANEGTLGSTLSTTAELRTQLTIAERKHLDLKDRINNFQVLPDYQGFEREATNLTLRLNELADHNTIDREFIAEQERTLEAEFLPMTLDLAGLYEEVGVILPQAVLNRFEEVKQFHEAVIHNRKSYLGSEIEAAQLRIVGREQEMRRLDERRSQIMNILRSHGALNQLLELQGEFARKEAEIEILRQRFLAAEQLEGLQTEMEIKRQQLRLRLIQNYQEQEDILKQAILAFEEVSRALYEDAGSLTIAPSLNGPEFATHIHGFRSKGIGNMQIFCFDMMLMLICAQRNSGPGFLIHDSHLFDGVDERQTASALKVGAELSNRLGFQYIVTLNSDQLSTEIRAKFDLERYVLPVQLSDERETGGLFGIRFN